MSADDTPDHGPGVRVPPPVIAAIIMAAAWVLDRLWTLQIGPPAVSLGGMVIFLAVGLVGWAVLALVKAGNDPRPDRPDAALVEIGPFKWSRNPIYLGFLLAATGDELLDWRVTIAHYPGARSVVVQGSDHGFTDFEQHLEAVLAFGDTAAASGQPL